MLDSDRGGPAATTRLAAVVGSPIAHSLSPALHNAGFDHLGLDWTFVAFECGVGSGTAVIEAATTLGLGGLSVTMPLKAEIAAALDHLEPAAAALGAVNCVYRDGERLVGANTDGEGFVASLDAAGVELAGKPVMVLGAGGAARAVAVALGGAGVSSVVSVNRTRDRAEALVELCGPIARVGEAGDLADTPLLVNATSVGMGSDEIPVDPALIGPAHVVVDLVYQPVDTALLAAARHRGARTLDGVGMLAHQAGLAFERWTGEPAPVSVMESAARSRV